VRLGHHGGEEREPGPSLPVLREDEKVLEVKGGKGQEAGVGFEDEGIPDGTFIDLAEVAFKPGVGGKQVGDQPLPGSLVRALQMLIVGQRVDEA
jgi:hypothetical protein